jgi:CheY-like chemotaxis protein
MSHELRTPLNSLLILARLLAQNPSRNLTAKQVEYADVIHSAGSDLLQLINDILDLSKVEVGRMDIHVERFTLGALLEDIQATFKPLTAEKGLNFAVETDDGTPTELVTDRQRLRQVLGNLLSNAVKFTEQGRVTLRVGARVGRGGTDLAFSVIDTGIGIAPENLSAIFSAFQQGDGTLSRRYGGTGLGLSIAREVGALLGGEITADSELGRGSTFTLCLPCTLPSGGDDPAGLSPAVANGDGRTAMNGASHTRAATAAPASDSASAARSPGDGAPADAAPADAVPVERRLLVLEGVSGGLLTLLAHSAISDIADIDAPVHVSTALTPEQGLEALASVPHACVVLDLGLPDASAFAFLEHLRERPEMASLPVLAHTRERADGAQVRLARLRFGSGALELLPSLDELRERITLHLSAAQPDRVPPLAGEAATPAGSPLGEAGHEELRGKKVLVIDDDPRNVFAITSTLELYGMTVTRSPNGRDGIETLLKAAGTDLILMDVMMPEMDGHATITAIRQMPGFAKLPIIAVTARAMPGDREKSLASGANDYVTKPVDTEELLGCMERWLSR